MTLVIIVAKSQNGVIGRQGGLPWHIPGDLRRFRELTIGQTVIMGRKTYESLPDAVRPLPGRTNIIVSRDPAYYSEGALVASSLRVAMKIAVGDPVFVIGGEQIYQLALPLADKILLTLVHREIQGDCYFPELDTTWELVDGWNHRYFEQGIEYTYLTYERRRS